MGMEKILIADDDPGILWVLEKLFKEKGFHTLTAKDGVEAAKLLKDENPALAFMDINMPERDGLTVLKETDADTQIIIMTAEGTMKNTIEAMKHGAFDYISKPFEIEEVEVLADKALDNSRLKREVTVLKDRLREKLTHETTFIGKSKAAQEVFKTVGKVSASNASILIQGESGTGKELIAKIIHANSGRENGPFIAVNSAAIPMELMESELFGYEKGAFTGASERRAGKFELASGGTIFLDEIGDMDLSLQAKLLRVVQEGEFYRVGGSKAVTVDVRILAATNRDLRVEAAEGRFREDLFYRLNVVTINIPPLRERRSDIAILSDHILRKVAAESGMEEHLISKDALKALRSYPWPGNVRELENVLRKAALLTSSHTIDTPDLDISKDESKRESIEDIITAKLEPFLERTDVGGRHELYDTIMPFMERPLIKLVLKKTRYNQVKSAEMLGINRNTLRKKIRELDIKLKD